MEAQSTLGEVTHELSSIANALGLEALARRIEEDSHRRLELATLRVAVLGEIKHGKSSLINALLGSAVVPTGVTPTTGAAVEIVRGEPGFWLVDAAEQEEPAREEVDADRFKRLARGKEQVPGRAIQATSDAESLLPGMEIVDTPGINDIDVARGHSSRRELPRGDVLLFVLDATQALNRTEMSYLRDAVVAVGGTGKTGAAILIALNRIDLIPERDRSLVREHVLRELKTIIPDVEVFETNARLGLKQPDSDTHGVREVARLRARLRALHEGRRSTLPRRTRTGLLRYARLLAQSASIQHRALTLELETLRAERDEVKAALTQHALDFEQLKDMMSETRAKILEQSRERLTVFHKELHAEAFAQLERPDLRVIAHSIPGAIQDSIMHFAHAEGERVRFALDALTREVLRTHGALTRKRLRNAALRFGFRGTEVHFEPPSVAVEVGMLTVGIVGTAIAYFGNFIAGMLVTIAGPLATMALRERSVRELRASAERSIPDALHTSITSLDQALTHVVDEHVDALGEHLVLANAELGQQLTALLDRANDVLSRSASADGAEGGYREAPPEDRRSLQDSRVELARLEQRVEALSRQLAAMPIAS
ncbi:MAG: dynamin family protein [Myxococcales bacterium]|nr:dynamin family protein [Myxococcales bacterium]MCB9750286.1 dynamin family protein [Myxococcales bacterium]